MGYMKLNRKTPVSEKRAERVFHLLCACTMKNFDSGTEPGGDCKCRNRSLRPG